MIESKNSNAKSLAGTSNASSFGGPAPLTTTFSYEPQRSDGDVKVKWDFGDGTTSTDASPTHTFKKAEYFAVRLDATDEGGNVDRHNLIVRAYKPEVWKAQTDPNAKREPGQAKKIIQASMYEYYSKYPEALPYNPKSEFFKENPFLRPLLKKRAKAIKEKGIQETPDPNVSQQGAAG